MWAKKEAGKNEMRALGVAGERWSVEATLRRIVACAVRATATRGRRGLHAARGLCSGRPPKTAMQFVS